MSSPRSHIPTPPALAEWLLAHSLPLPVRRSVLGDLREEYASISDSSGRGAARSWYWLQVLNIGSRYVLARFERTSYASRDERALRPSIRAGLVSIRPDVRFAIRLFTRQGSFALTVLLMIGLGVGATTTIFSVVDGVVLRDLPYPRSEELVFFDNPSHPPPLFVDWRDRTDAFATMAGVWDREVDLTGEDAPQNLIAAYVTPDFFGILGATPRRGRLLAGEDFEGEPRVAMLSNRIWRTRWGSDDEIIGRTIRINGEPLEIVGVLQADFQSPEALVDKGAADLWIPLDVMRSEVYRRDRYMLSVVGRLRSGVSLKLAQAEVDALSSLLAEEHPDQHRSLDGSPRLYPLTSLKQATIGDVRNVLFMFLGATGLMLLIACANVANLFLARGIYRRRELAVRSALGAARSRVFLQLLTESVTLAALGGAVGIAIAFAGVKAFQVLNPGGIPRIDNVSVDLRLLGFGALASVATGILFGILPALQGARASVGDVLKESAGTTTAGRGRLQLRNALVALEIAVSLVLLAGAGLLFNSFVRLKNVEPGFASDGVIAVQLKLGPTFSEARRVDFSRDLLRRIETIPGVDGVGAGATLPLSNPRGSMCCWYTNIESTPATDDDSPAAIIHPVTPGYFSTLSAEIVRGRAFVEGDENEVPPPAIVNLAVARRLFGDGEAVGSDVMVGDTRFTVVGVSRGIRHWAIHREIDLDVYVPHAAFAGDFRNLQIGVKTNAEPGAIADAIRAAVWEVDANLPADRIAPLEELVSLSIATPRFYSTILITFAAISILLAAAGVYGSFTFLVGQRKREIGIRLALGAGQRSVAGIVLRSGLAITTVGIAFGLVGSYALSATLKNLVYGITPTDPVTFLVVSLLLVGVAIAACYLPARSAAATDPIETLRTE